MGINRKTKRSCLGKNRAGTFAKDVVGPVANVPTPMTTTSTSKKKMTQTQLHPLPTKNSSKYPEEQTNSFYRVLTKSGVDKIRIPNHLKSLTRLSNWGLSSPIQTHPHRQKKARPSYHTTNENVQGLVTV